MAIDPNKLVKLQQLQTFKQLSDLKYQDKNLSAEINGLTATTVEDALAELVTLSGTSDVSFQKLTSANTNPGMLATYRFTKGSGNNATTLDIDIPKDYVNNIIGIVAKDGEDHDGTFLKVNVSPTGEAASYEYVDVSGLIEYITVGTQTGLPVQLSINADHQITADISAKAISKSHLADAVQTSLGLADTALQASDIAGKADKVSGGTAGNLVALDANGNIVDANLAPSAFQLAGNYKTVQTAVSDPSASGNATAYIDSISQDTNGVITATKKTIPNVSASTSGAGGNAGLMRADQAEKLDNIAYATDTDIHLLFDPNYVEPQGE